MHKRLRSLQDIDKRLAALSDKLRGLDKNLATPYRAVGAFVTGRSGRSKSLDRQVDAENNKRSRWFNAAEAARKEIRYLTALRAEVEAGERHPDGQPRADAPSRKRESMGAVVYAAWFKSVVKVGDQVAVSMNPANLLTVKRLSAKSVTTTDGTNWQYLELLPTQDGQALSGPQLRESLKAWMPTWVDSGASK